MLPGSPLKNIPKLEGKMFLYSLSVSVAVSLIHSYMHTHTHGEKQVLTYSGYKKYLLKCRFLCCKETRSLKIFWNLFLPLMCPECRTIWLKTNKFDRKNNIKNEKQAGCISVHTILLKYIWINFSLVHGPIQITPRFRSGLWLSHSKT